MTGGQSASLGWRAWPRSHLPDARRPAARRPRDPARRENGARAAAPGTARTRPPDVRRRQLLDAAERVLLDRGLANTTIAEVAVAAGVAKGTVYLYFASKNELLAALRARYLEQYAAALDVATGSARDRIRAFAVGFYEFAATHRDLHHVLFHEAGFSEEHAFSALRTRLRDLIAQGVADGELTRTAPDLAASYVLHGMHGALVEALHDERVRDRTAVAEQVATLVDQTLAVPDRSRVRPARIARSLNVGRSGIPLLPPLGFTARTWWIWLLPSSKRDRARGHVEAPHPRPVRCRRATPPGPSRLRGSSTHARSVSA